MCFGAERDRGEEGPNPVVVGGDARSAGLERAAGQPQHFQPRLSLPPVLEMNVDLGLTTRKGPGAAGAVARDQRAGKNDRRGAGACVPSDRRSPPNSRKNRDGWRTGHKQSKQKCNARKACDGARPPSAVLGVSPRRSLGTFVLSGRKAPEEVGGAAFAGPAQGKAAVVGTDRPHPPNLRENQISRRHKRSKRGGTKG